MNNERVAQVKIIFVLFIDVRFILKFSDPKSFVHQQVSKKHVMLLVDQVMILISMINVRQVDLNQAKMIVRIYLNYLHSINFLLDRSYQNNRYRDETTDSSHHQDYTSPSKTSFQSHLNRLDERFGHTYNARPKGKNYSL